MKYKPRNRKGFLFTIGIIIFLIPLLFLLSYYTESSNTRRVDSVTKIRCDELHYLVEDIERDMERAVVIFGRRAALYATGWAVDNRPLANYTFNCSINCGLDCDGFSFDINGSEAAIAELVACGTLNSTNVTYMVNHTLREWVDRIELHGVEAHFDVNITPLNISVVPINAWEFAVIIWNNLEIIDESGTCSYKETPIMVMSNTSIVGIEDPLYPLNTQGRITKYIQNCSIDMNITYGDVSGEEWQGDGNATGIAVLFSNISGNSTYCVDEGEDLNDQILIIDTAFGNCNGLGDHCYNISDDYHFAGIVDYKKNDPINSLIGKCGISIPWIWGTGDVGVTDGDCIYFTNDGEIHRLGSGTGLGNLTTMSLCYRVSNTSLSSGNCSSQYPDGPSFFDRLDGNYNLSQKYRDQANSTFGNPWIGIETLIDPVSLEYYGLEVYDTASWIDYLYWNNSQGDKLCGICLVGDNKFRMDCQHLLMHNLTICA